MTHFGKITNSIGILGLIQDVNYLYLVVGPFLLLFLRKLHSRPARTLEWHSEQQKASALPVWSSSAAKTLVKGVFLNFGAFAALVGPTVWAKGNAATTEL